MAPRDTRPIPPDILRCQHIHNTAAVATTSINANPKCDGRCSPVTGHPHPGGTARTLATLGATAKPFLVDEAMAFLGVWEYSGGCCLCAVCGYWVKDWHQQGPPRPCTPSLTRIHRVVSGGS